MEHPSAEPLAIQAVGLHKTFSGRHAPVHAVAGISLSIRRGEIIGLLGPNGAGKSTLVDLLLGLTAPDQGTVQVFGESPRRAVEQGRIGAVLQTGGLLQDLTVAQTIRMLAATHHHPLPVDQALAAADLQGLAGRRVSKCSGGEQQRLRLALALLPHPELLVLDEPTTGMDPLARQRFWETMRAQAQSGRTILFATHYLEEAEHFADRILLVDQGRVAFDGTPAEVRQNTPTRTVSAVLPPDLEARTLPGVQEATTASGRTVLTTCDSDALARHLLSRTQATDLLIEQASLEDAFATLTTTEQD